MRIGGEVLTFGSELLTFFSGLLEQHGQGYRNLQLRTVIEDANFRESATSYLIQSADLCAFLLYQQRSPSSYMKKKSGQNYFNRLDPILCRQASPRDPQGIVRL